MRLMWVEADFIVIAVTVVLFLWFPCPVDNAFLFGLFDNAITRLRNLLFQLSVLLL